MRLNELFTPTESLIELNPNEVMSRYGLSDILAASEMQVGEDTIIFYFDKCGGKPEEPTFGFGRVIDDDGRLRVNHSLTGSNLPYKVLAGAIQAISNYIERHNPLSVCFKGAYDRQQAFYEVLVKRFTGKLPPGYKLVIRQHSERFYITRNPELLAMPTTKVIEGRIDELFDSPVADYELEDLSPGNARAMFHISGTEAAYIFNIMGSEYVVYFTPYELTGHSNGKKMRGWFDCSFGLHKAGGGIIFNLTGSSPKDQFKVFRMVFAGIQKFIATHNPVGIVGGGYVKRQAVFYRKLLQAYESRLPKPYFWAMDGDKVIITRSKNVVPERDSIDRMKAAEQPVEEGAAEDVSAVRQAERIVSKYIHWLANANEEKPLEDIMERTFKPGRNEHILYASGETIGLPEEYHDLNIGFAWTTDGRPSNVKGWLNPMDHPMGGPRKYLTCLVRETDPSKDVDLAYELGSAQKEFLVHEITHYLDYKRSTIKPGSTQKLVQKRGQAAGYYNSPLEFNAFFQQGLHGILKDLKERPMGSRFRDAESLSSFEKFLKDHLYIFDLSFRENLDAVYKKKFKRRLYKLYDLIKANPNDPDQIAAKAAAITD